MLPTLSRHCRGLLRLPVSFIALLALALGTARADVLIWDANTTADDAQDGTGGGWTSTGGNWFNFTQTLQNRAWVNGSDAVFGAGNGGAGTIILSGPTITAGSLTFNAAATGTYTLGGSGTLELSNNAIVTTNASGTISAILTGSTPWTKTGAGTLTLSGSTINSHTGTLTLNQGRLALAKTGSGVAIAGNLNITNGAFVTFGSATNQFAANSAVTMSGEASVLNGTSPNNDQTNSLTQTLASLTIAGGTFNAGAASTWNIAGTFSMTGGTVGSRSVFVGNSAAVMNVGGLSLVDMNGTSSSAAVLNGFTLFGNGGTNGTTRMTVGSGGVYLQNSFLYLGAGNTGSLLYLNGDVSTGGTGNNTIQIATGSSGITPTLGLGTSGIVNRTFTIAAGANLNVSVAVSNGTATGASLIKAGAGTLTLSGSESNTYTGDTIINAGRLILAKTASVTSVAGNIIVNTGGILQMTTSNQIGDSKGITLNGGSWDVVSTEEIIAYFTQNSGGVTGNNTGRITITGALTLAGGSQLTINSSASPTPASWSAGSLIMTGVDILIGGNNGAANPRTALTIGSGGLYMAGRVITLNPGDAGVVINLNGDYTGVGTNSINSGGSGGVQGIIAIGSATRTFNVLSGTTNVNVGITGAGGSLVKNGPGLMNVTAANTYTGATTISGGTLAVAGGAGALTATSGVLVNGGGILQNGSPVNATNNGVSNRITTAAVLTLGGGTFTQVSAAAGSHTQSLAGLAISGGLNTVSVTALTGTTNTLTFSGASPYTRTGGVVNFVQNTALGGSITFTNAPSGAGNVISGFLIGATLNGTDLVAAQAGVLTAFSGWVPTGTSTWTTAAAMDVTGTNLAAYAATDIAALRFNTVGPFTVTLAGTHTINGSTVLMTPNAGAGTSIITGGTLRGPAGSGLVLAQYNTVGSLEIASSIADNATASDLVKSGAGLVILSGLNTYTGVTRVNEGVLRAAEGVGLPTSSALELNGGALEFTTGSFTRALGTGAGQVTLGGASAGFSAAGTAATVNIDGAGGVLQWGTANFNPAVLLLNASTATAAIELVNSLDLNGAPRTIRVDAIAANAATISTVISNSVSGSPAGLTKSGVGTLRLTQANTYDGGTTIAGGLIALGHNQALGAGTITLSGGGLQADGAARTLANNIVLAGASTVVSAQNLTLNGTFTNSGGTQTLATTLTGGAILTVAGNVYLSDSAAVSRVMQITGSGDRVISGVIANNAGDNALASNLFFNGGGTLTMSAVNTYTGRTLTAGGGYIVLNQDRNLGAAPVAPMVDSLILASNGRIRATTSFTLDANRGIGIGNSNGGVATGQIDVTTGVTFTVAGTIANRTLNQDGSVATAANVGSLTKTGTGVLELSGNNTYSGLTLVSNGILRIKSNTALGSTIGGTEVSSAGHVELADGVVVTGETITINTGFGSSGPGSPTVNRGGLQAAVNATAEWAGNVIMGVDLARLGVQEGGTLKISGNITDGSNIFSLRLSGEMTGTGGLILSGTGNAWDGQTEIVRGKIFLGAHNTLPTTTVLDIHFTDSNNSEYAGLDMNGFNQTISSLRNEGNTNGANAELTNSSRILSTMTVNETGAITYNGVINGNLALVKNGAGTMILTQTNRLTGGITVNDGLLRIGAALSLAEGDVAVNGGASTAGKLDVNNLATAVNALNGSAGSVAGLIANESTTNATRFFSIGVNHGSGSYAGQIVDNTGGTALGKIAVAKIGTGTQVLSGTGTYTGGTYVSNGTLIADYATGTPLGSSTISLQGGTLALRNASSAALGNVALVQSGTEFTSSVLRVEGAGSATASQLTLAAFAPLLIDLSSGSSFAATALSGASMTNGIVIGTTSGRANVLVKDATGVGFAVHNSTSGQITRYTGATALPSGSTATTSDTNYVVSASLTRSAALNFQTLQIDTSGGNVALNLGSSNMTTASGRVVLVTGTNNASITSTGAVTSGSIFLANHSTGALTVDISLASQSLVNMGPGLVDYTHSGVLGDVYVAGGVLRISGADRDFSSSTSVVRIYGGGVLELGADLNGTGTAGAFTRAVGQGAGQVALLGNGGFSAHGADRVVALGGVGTAAAQTWGANNFLAGPSTTTDANYTFMLGSATSTHTVEFQNAIALGSRERRIEVADGTSTTNTDARLTGVLSGAGGSIVKEGAGRLEFTAANTYTGTTEVNAGSLVITSTGRTGTGAVSVAANATLMGSGMVQGSSFTLAANASLHAGNGTTSTSIGTLTFQTAAKASFDIQAGSLITLDIQTANNQSSIDPLFGGHTIGSADYNSYVDAFSGVGAGAHDLLVFSGATGSTLAFSGNLSVRPEGFNATAGQVFNLLDWGTVSADFTGFNVGTNFRTGADDNGSQFDLPELTGGLFWDVSRFTTSGVIVVVPEPGRALLLMLGFIAFLFRRRR